MPLARLWLTHLITGLLLVALQLPVTAGVALAADHQGTLKIGGTGAALATMAQVAAAFQKKNPGVRVVIPPSLGSTGGIKAVIAGALDLGLSSRPLTEAEARQGVVALEYARSPFLLVTSHKAAGVNFTLKQLASLYAGDITSFHDGAPIRLIIRPDHDVDTRLLRSLSPEMDQAVQKAQTRQGMIVAVTDHDNGAILEKSSGALGWLTLAQLISENLKLEPVPIDNILPSQANFASGKYPFFKSFSVVTGAQPTPLTKAFLEFLASAEGRAILLRNGHFLDLKQP